MNIENFLTLQNAITYNNITDKLFFIADQLEISPRGNKVLAIEGKLIEILELNNIEIRG
jgi:hypothetical protein